jgi:hypothetical protein
MAANLSFNVYCNSLNKLSAANLTGTVFNVFLDQSNNSTYENKCFGETYIRISGNTANLKSTKLTPNSAGTFTALSATTAPIVNSTLYRIRILRNTQIYFCSAWFYPNNNGYGDYLTYYGTQVTSGLYRIIIPFYGGSMSSLDTSATIRPSFLYNGCPTYKGNINAAAFLYVYYGGCSSLEGGTKYKPCIGNVDITNFFNGSDSTFSISVPTTSANSAATNTMSYFLGDETTDTPSLYFFDELGIFDTFTTRPSNSAFTHVAYDGCSVTPMKPKSTKQITFSFYPPQHLMANRYLLSCISYSGQETGTTSTMYRCPNKSDIKNMGYNFSSMHELTDGDKGWYELAPLSEVHKNNPNCFSVVFLTSGYALNVSLQFSADTGVENYGLSNFPGSNQTSGLTAIIKSPYFLKTSYIVGHQTKPVKVAIGGYIPSTGTWYYRVVDHDGNIIVNTRKVQNNMTFNTISSLLDGATMFFAQSATINETSWSGATRAKDGPYNYTVSSVTCSWLAADSGTTTTSLASIGDWDY